MTVDHRPPPDPPDDHLHHWVPLSFRFESQLLDPEGRVMIRQPSMEEARVYCVCMGCHGWTYMQVGWVGYYLEPPDHWLDYFDPSVSWAQESRRANPRRYLRDEDGDLAAEAEE